MPQFRNLEQRKLQKSVTQISKQIYSFQQGEKMNLNSKKSIQSIMISLLLIASILSAAFLVGTAEAKPKTDAQAFHDAMRKLWEDHITWTRLVIVSISNDLPDTETTVQRLLQNQVDLGNAIKPFYGEEAGDQLTALLTDHILIAAEIIQAAKSGDTAARDDAIARWYANADDIAEFLHAANPENWPLEEMRAMMREHLDLTLEEAVAYLTGDFAASVTAYDQIHAQALEMADMLSDGIIRQFPKMFK
jgi:hypothetical protein